MTDPTTDPATSPEDALHALGDAVPVGTPSVPELVAGGRAIRRRRTTLAVFSAAAAAAVVLVVAGSAFVGQAPRSTDHQAAPIAVPPASDSVTAASGMRLVGSGRAVVEVPADWVDTDCDVGSAGHVVFDRGDECPVVVGDLGPSVTIGMTSRPSAPVRSAGAINGTAVLQTTLTCEAGSCVQEVTVPSERAFLRFKASGAEARSTVERLRSSLRLLPEGYTTVPSLRVSDGVAQARRLLTRAGLGPVADPDLPAGNLTLDPPAGSVVVRPSQVDVLAVADLGHGGTSAGLVTSTGALAGTWEPTSLDGQALTQPTAEMTFAVTGGLTANDGCGVHPGDLAIVDGVVSVQIRGPYVACLNPDPPVDAVALLQATRHLELNSEHQLILFDATGRELAVLTPTSGPNYVPGDTPSVLAAMLLGTWQVTSVGGRHVSGDSGTLAFTRSTVEAAVGCASDVAGYAVSAGGRFTLGGTASGNSCPERPGTGLDLLRQATRLHVDYLVGELLLTGPHGRVAVLRRVPAGSYVSH